MPSGDPPPKGALKVLLVDDHSVFRAGSRILLEQSGFDVIEADSGELACDYARVHKPDVILMDLTMPGMGGLAATHRLIHRDRNTRILVLSMHEDDATMMRALAAGARGFVTKTAAPAEVIEAIRTVIGGEIYLPVQAARRIAARRARSDTDPLKELSNREYEIFRRLAAGDSTNEISAALKISAKTVANHRGRILQKLGVKNVVQLAQLANTANDHALAAE